MRDKMAWILRFCEQPRLLKEILDFLNLKDRKYFMKRILSLLLKVVICGELYLISPKVAFKDM